MLLTPLELDIMKAVWRSAPITVREVQEAIRPGRQLAYTTVMTVMDRLFHKGFLTRTLHSRAHFYEPAIAYTDARDEALERLIKSFFGSKEKLIEFLEAETREFVPTGIPETHLNSIGPPLDETLL